MIGAAGWLGVPSDRVVAVEAILASGKYQVGSGYLLTRETVVTAGHCTVDKKTGEPAVGLRVLRRSDGASSPARVLAVTLDVAVLTLTESAAWPSVDELELPVFGCVDASHSGELLGCEAVGFPLWQFDPARQRRNGAELHGVIRATEGAEAGLLVMRDPLLLDVGDPSGVADDDQAPGSPWGGLSGALVFHAGTALGVVVEHHPRQGHAALTIRAAERVARSAAAGDLDAVKVAAALGLPRAGELQVVRARRVGPAAEHLIIGLETAGPSAGPSAADRLAWVLAAALRVAGISLDQCERQEAGAGREILILPSGLDITSTSVTLLRAMGLMAGQVDAAPAAGSGGPVLAALARGRIKFARAAYDGPGISAVVNMLASGTLRGEIRPRTDAVFTAMLSNDLYLKIYSQGYGLFDFSQFRPVGECWLYTPKASADPRPTVSFGGALTTAAGSRMVGVIPLAGLGALMMWHHSAQSHAYEEHVVDPGREHQDVHDRVHSTQHDQVHPGTDHWIDHGPGSFTDYPDQHGY